MSVGVGLMVAGKAMKAWGQYQSLLEQSDMMYESAAADRMQAAEIRRRADMNKKVMERDAQRLLAEQQGMYAGSGVEVSSGAPLSTMIDTMDTVVTRLNMLERETAYSEMIKSRESEMKFRRGGQLRTAADLSLLGSGVEAGGDMLK